MAVDVLSEDEDDLEDSQVELYGMEANPAEKRGAESQGGSAMKRIRDMARPGGS